jgi:hypothetical protein
LATTEVHLLPQARRGAARPEDDAQDDVAVTGAPVVHVANDFVHSYYNA